MKLQDINPKDITLLKEKYQSAYPKILDKITKEDYPMLLLKILQLLLLLLAMQMDILEHYLIKILMF